MTNDEYLAAAIRSAQRVLNTAIRLAEEAGMTVTLNSKLEREEVGMGSYAEFHELVVDIKRQYCRFY